MDKIQAKMKEWVKAIAALEIESVAAELQELLDSDVNKPSSKSLFKLLLYLSHAAYGCDRKKFELGLEIWKLARSLCSNMSAISDYKRFFPGVFHITKCLLEMELYEEAMEIFDCTMSVKPSRGESSEYEEMYRIASSQWKVTVCNDLLKKLDPTSERQRQILIKAIEYEVNMAMLASRDYSLSVLDRVVLYCKQIRTIGKRSASSILEEEFKTFVVTYIWNNKISLSHENKHEIFKLICLLITEMIVGSVNERSILVIGQKSNVYFGPFRNSVKKHSVCYDCFNLYERMCKALLRPIKNLTAATVKDIDACTKDFSSIITHYTYGEPVKSFMYAAFLLFSSLLVYWDEAAREKVACLTNNVIVAALKLFSACSAAFNLYEPSNCRCGSERCLAKYDVYSTAVLNLKSLSVASRVMSLTVTEELSEIVLKIVVQSVSGICEMKDTGCKRWSELWATCGAYMYNMGVSCEPKHYDYSVRLHSLLCQNFIRLEGVKPTTCIVNLKDPLSDVLHRLTSVHLNHGRYEEASIVCSLNGLLSYEKSESKAYRYWANIKRKDPQSHGLTMLQCLRSNSGEIAKIVYVELEEYDQIEVCLREIKGLQEARANLSSSITAVLDMMESLNAAPARYAQGVQLLGYHLLNFKHEQSIGKYVKKAMSRYELDESPSASFRWCYGQLQLYKFIERLAKISKKTQSEMKSAEFPSAASAIASESSSVTSSGNVVPTYSTINFAVIIELEGLLRLTLQGMEEALGYGFKGMLKEWEASQALHTVTIAGEYARLYNFETLEIQAWKLAYKLAEELKDDRTIVYVTSRSLSSRQIDSRWIDRANESAERLVKPDDRQINETITRYRLCLASFYFKNNQRCEAKKCLSLVTANIGSDFLADISNYLLRNDITMNHLWDEVQSDDNQLVYHGIIVEIFYGLLTLDSTLDTVIYGNKEKQLYDYDVILEYTNNFTMRVNSLVSFQEISAHLNLRLTTAQKLGAALRVAECLKSLCYVDLSRAQVDDCEVKLQGLEHILDIKAFGLSAESEPLRNLTSKAASSTSPMRTPQKSVDPGQSDASPVLRKRSFTPPDFMLHDDSCRCFKCTNERYRYLVFACTHIRAQLYSLQRHRDEAMQYFSGAIQLRKRILMKDSSTPDDTAGKKMKVVTLQRQQVVLESVMFHLDYCRFLKFYMPSKKIDAMKFSQEALNLCEVHFLKNHPIYVSVNEFILECRFEKTFTEAMYSKFTVPAIDDIDISCYLDEPVKRPVAFSTPARDTIAKEVKSVRRKKTPPFLKLNKVTIDLTEEGEEQEEPPISTSPTSAPKRVCRKITEQDYSDAEVASSAQKSLVPKIKVTIPKEKAFAKTRKLKDRPSGDQGNAAAGISSIASISLNSVGEDDLFETSQSTGQLDQLVDMVKELKVHPQTQSLTKRRIKKESQQESASSSPSSSTEASGKPCETMNEVTELFNEMTVAKTPTSSLAPRGRSSKTRKPAKNSDCGRLKKSSSVSMDSNIITLSDGSSDAEDDGRRASARLRKKNNDSSIAKDSSLKSLDKSAGSVSNSEDEVVIIGTRTRKRAAASLTEQGTLGKEVSKSTRSRVTKKDS